MLAIGTTPGPAGHSPIGPKEVLTLTELVARMVPDGQELLIGGFAYSEPIAFAHELIRQRRKNLFVWKTSGGVLVDQLIGAGCVDRVAFCHLWNSVGPVPAYCFRRAVEHNIPQPLLLDELSYGAFSMGLLAAACGLPFMPTTPVQQTGHFMNRPLIPNKFAVITSPFSNQPVCVVPAIRPPLGVFHVQRVDKFGNAQVMGPLGEMKAAMLACDRVAVIAEELVDTSIIRERPELTIIPGFRVDAIAIEPWGAHPSDVYGYYLRDLNHNALYGRMSSSESGFQEYIEEWVTATHDHSGFRQKLGLACLQQLMVEKRQWW
jgi:glutaconate CoA-transferase subunit A